MSMQPEESSPASRGDRQMVLMFTDIVDSVAIKRQIGDLAYVEALNAHLKRLAAAITAESGASVIKSTGDGLLARFQTPGDAVRAALRIQAGGGAGFQPADSAEENAAKMAAPPRSLPDRIGIHAGVGIETTDPSSGKPDVAGLAVDMAARVMGLCEPGQILLTRAAFDDARQFVREHPGSVGVASSRPSSSSDQQDSGKDGRLEATPTTPTVTWMAHGPYLFKGAEDDPLEVFEVGGAGIAPLKAPRDSEKARRAVAPGEEAMYDWRPAVGLEVPRKANWLLERKLGEGGFGEVWLAKQRKTGDQRVFKFCFDADRLRSFRRELTLFRLLREALGDRRDIARIFDVSLEHAPFSLESEYSPGGDLYDWADRQGGIGTLPLATRLDLLRRVAEAVAAAHSVGILHKDLKPSNILMDTAEDGSPRPKLADFGIGVLADRSRLEGAGFTIGGFTMGGGATLTQNDSSRTGTRLYSPPESMTNVRTTDGGEAKAAPFTAKGDVFALGVMLYQFVIGDLDRPLAQGWERNVEGAVGSVGVASSRPSSTSSQGPQGKEGRQDATPTSAADPHLLAILKADIAEMTDGDPDRRVASAAEVARRLASVEERRGQLQRESEVQQATARAEARNRKLKLVASIAVGVLLLLTVVGSYAIYSINQEREAANNALADKVKAEEQRAEAEGRADAIWDSLRKHRLEQIDNAMSALAASPLASAVEAARTARLAVTEDSWSPIPPMQLMELREATHQLLESVMLAENLLHLQTDMIGNRPAEILTLEQEWQSLTEIWNARSESIRLALATREFGLAMSIYQAAEAEMMRRFSAFDIMERMQQVESWRESAPQVAMEAAQRLAAIGESILRAQGRQQRWRRQRIEFALDDVRQGLGRADRPRDAPYLEDYVFELVGYRDLQTVELLGEELKQHAIKAGWVADVKPEPKEVLWSQEERDLITLASRVLGRIGLGNEAVASLTPISQVMVDHTLVVQIGIALGNTKSAEAWEPLFAMRRRVTTTLQHPMLSTSRLLPPITLSEVDPDTALAFCHRGEIRQFCQDLPGAIADFTRAIELDPDLARAFNNRGLARSNSGDLPGAIQDYTRAIELDPIHARAFNNRGIARQDSGDLPRAILDYTRAIELDPFLAMAFNNRGNARLESKDYFGAIQDHTRAIELDPNLAMAFNNRGRARRDSGDLPGAIQDFTRAIDLDPNLSMSYNNRGTARRDSEDYAGAIQDFTRSIELDPNDAKAFNARGTAQWASGDPSGAIEDFTRAIELDPNLALAFMNRGAAWQASGDLAAAIQDYTRAIDLDPNNAKSYSNRGFARRDSGDLSGAIEDCTRSIQLDPNYAPAFNNRGIARRDTGDPSGAIEDYSRAIELDPNYAFAYANRGLARRGLGEIDSALADFEKAAELMPRHAGIIRVRDELHALVALKAWLTQAATTPAEHFTKAQAHAAFAKGDTLAAELVVAEAEYMKGAAALGESTSAELQAAAAKTADQLGTAFYTAKLYPKSVEWYAKALALRQHLPSPAGTAYNGACAAALAGQEKVGEGTQPPKEGEVGGDAHPPKLYIDKAFEWLALAAELGYANAEHASKDPDLTSLHQDPRWEPAIERIRKNAAPEPEGE